MSPFAAPSGAPIHSNVHPEPVGLGLRDLWHVLKKRKGLIAFVFVLSVGSVAAITFSATRIYTAETQLLIERRTPRVMDIEAVLAESLGTDEATYYKTQHEILKSPGLATRSTTSSYP